MNALSDFLTALDIPTDLRDGRGLRAITFDDGVGIIKVTYSPAALNYDGEAEFVRDLLLVNSDREIDTRTEEQSPANTGGVDDLDVPVAMISPDRSAGLPDDEVFPPVVNAAPHVAPSVVGSRTVDEQVAS